ncbi:Plexin domain-containing protein 2 [Pseudolycoriella hygida]|uniref:Plexin domain-containing protein 2 n=1 Tax=Pseudolycoriella hygida TaxID=35572 RepID=A0A9Q0MR92_9DIPT|nr:Plexin domain-containing protein 2 [Pseudolycoriella hygida]
MGALLRWASENTSFSCCPLNGIGYDRYYVFSNLEQLDPYSTIVRKTRQTSIPIENVPQKTSTKESLNDSKPSTLPSPNNSDSINRSSSAKNDSTDASASSAKSKSVSEQRPNVGVNGTGQLNVTMLNGLDSKLIPPALQNIKPNPSSSEDLENAFFDEFDVADNETIKAAENNNITAFKEVYHVFYNSTSFVDPDRVNSYWESFKNHTVNSMLSKSHRRAITVQLTFDFPFYGHAVRNVTVATGGFLYTGEYVHSWLAATQYIAPLMANFDTSISNNSFVRFYDNGTAFTVVWENVSLQDKQDVGQFTFSVTLHESGDIVFVYYSLPIQIHTIQDDKHPVKIGLSDAYIIDKTIFFARRKTIYEYHRVNFDGEDIANDTIITLTANPTCHELTNCEDCVNFDLQAGFKCYWCTALNKCSTGTDRKRQEWLQKGCDRSNINNASTCPKPGTPGNNYGAVQEVKDVSGDKYLTGDVPTSNVRTQNSNDVHISNAEPLAHDDGGGVGVALGLFVPAILVMCLVLWVFYAYRNPHTKSGQLLIQVSCAQLLCL